MALLGIYRFYNKIRYANSAALKYNITPDRDNLIEWESVKKRRWIDSLDKEDRKNIAELADSLCKAADDMNVRINAYAHGSSTYGKKRYGDVDILVEIFAAPFTLGLHNEILGKLPFRWHSPDGGFRVLDMHTEQYKINPEKGKSMDIGMTIDERSEDRYPLSFEERTRRFRNHKKSYVALIKDNRMF